LYNKGPLGRMKPENAPTEQAQAHDIVWAAGIFEGEGSCQRSGRGKGTQTLYVPQKDAWVVERLRALFGGRLTQPPSVGVYRWTLTGARARGFLLSIYGLLSPRRQIQVRKALSGE